ncbi:MAG TPA: DUF1015 domain-containing protein, partial [Actinomycetota bacterium]|nr:DUF1015 domain-containing protein [Actinomycetota bacterium]
DFVGPKGDRRRVVGVIGALGLEPFGDASGVLPHERTMPGPKEDRLALMHACPVNISPIYAIYRGAGQLRPFFDTLEQRQPEARWADDTGILHRCWVVAAPAEVELIRTALAPGPLVIADGHHRYETALEFHSQNAGKPGDHGSIMTFCVDVDSEELVVLPYHRALRAQTDDALSSLTEGFGAVRSDGDHEEVLNSSSFDHPFVIALKAASVVAGVSDEQVVRATGERHHAWRALDVVALHEVLIPAVFGEVDELRFSRDADEIRELVDSGWDAGVLLRALGATEVVDVASSGERMPQKASYFWPKALTGLVFHSLR